MDSSTKQLHLLKLVEEIDGYAILLLDKAGNIETWNKGSEKIKGYKADEIIGKNIAVFYTTSDQQNGLPAALLAEAAVKGNAYNETWRVRKNRSVFWGSVTIIALHDDEGELVGYAKITRDLTEKMFSEASIKHHVEELEFKNKEIEQFVYIASHDLQEPLNSIKILVDFFQDEYQDLFDENGSNYLVLMAQSIERMKSLVTSLLGFSLLGTEKNVSTINCNHVLKAVMNDLAVKIKESGAVIHYYNLPTITGYETEIRLLFQNLISNAIKFRRENIAPEIFISAVQEYDCCRFSVKDNGIGIDQKHKEQIFLIFKRLNSAEVYEGNGIGLAHCKKIIELHGGTISVESTPGQGSTFIFTIPN